MSAIAAPANARAMPLWRAVLSIFKLRIGLVIALTALAGLAVSGGTPDAMQAGVLFLTVFFSSASAGAFNQYYEADLDPLMQRTARRMFASGAFAPSPRWLLAIVGILLLAVVAAWQVLNVRVALYVFLGAFFYGVVYTVWLKRRTWMNIVVGGLAGSWAVLAGAAVAQPQLEALPLALALILFLWTPPHFWSLAFACRDDYARAGVPMLPTLLGEKSAARVIFFSTAALVAATLLPAFLGLGRVYLAGALLGGALFLLRAGQLLKNPGRTSAMRCFHASLMQLGVLLLAIFIDMRL